MKRICIIAILMATAFCACQNSKIEMHGVTSPNNEILFNFISPRHATKAGNGVFDEGDMLGVYIADYRDNGYPNPLQPSGNRANNVSFTYGGSTWTPEYPIYWGTSPCDVYAYYPFIAGIKDINEHYFEIASDQSGTGLKESDLLWAKTECVSRGAGTVNLTMQHLMSKLTVKVLAGDKYIGSLPEDAVVYIHNTVSGACVDLENGVAYKNPYCEAKSIKMKKVGKVKDNGVESIVFEAVVVPQMIESIVPLLEINTKSISYIVEDFMTFSPGISYVYTVTLNSSSSAIKVEIGCELEDWNNPEGGNGDNNGDGEGDDDEEESISYVDLSENGTANCYCLQQSGDYKFKAALGNSNLPVGNIKSAEVLWESFGTNEEPNVGDLIEKVSYKDGYVRFTTPKDFKEGNAVVAVKNSKGTILWSWHIWCSAEGWEEQVYYNNAGTMMDRDLGSLSSTPGDERTVGLVYQWGRKDPFILANVASTGSWNSATTGTSSDCDANPMTTYQSLNKYSIGMWQSDKTVMDPCPLGWRVPEGGKNGVWATALSSAPNANWTYDKQNLGVNFSGILGADQIIWYPYGNGYDWWSCTAQMVPNIWGEMTLYEFYSFGYNTSSNYTYNLGFSWGMSRIRCQKE